MMKWLLASFQTDRCYGDVRSLIRAQDGGGVVLPILLFKELCLSKCSSWLFAVSVTTKIQLGVIDYPRAALYL